MARLFRRQENPLLTDLKKTTDSGVIDVPKTLLDSIVDASKNEEDRKVIMAHLRECLKEPSGKRWRRVHAALAVADDLFEDGRGAPELVKEVASGIHFDLVQTLAFLEVYQHSEAREQNLIRSKAKALRAALVPRFQSAAFDEAGAAVAAKDSASTCSTTGPLSIDDTSAHDSPLQKAGGARVLYSLGNIVACGHNEDTTDESSGDEEQKKRKAQRKKAAEERRAERQRAAERREVTCLPVPCAPVQQMNLLDF
jgi:hypothetical protein